MFTALPDEILVLIIQAVDRDLTDLQNLALACRTLLPVIREELFSIVNVCALQEPCIRPYFNCISKLRIEEPNPVSDDAANGRFVPYLDPHALPRLRSLHFNGLGVWFFVKMPTALYQALSSFTSVTTLALSGSVYFVNFRQIRTLVCSLPNLSELSLREVGYIPWRGSMPEGYDQWADGLSDITGPRLSRLTIAPSSTTDDVASWLAFGPSKDSLTTLVVPPRSNAPHYVLKYFGPSIEHIGIPLNGQGSKPSAYTLRRSPTEMDVLLDRACYSRCLKTYTNLRTLRLFLDTVVESPHAWGGVPRLLQYWIPAEHLHAIAIDVLIPYEVLERCDWQLDAQLDWDVLHLLNHVLGGPKFAVLDTVEFNVQWIGKWDPGEEVRDALARRIEETLRKVAETRTLVTSVRGLQEVLPRVRWRGSRPKAG
ncbi:hypothetical protein TRAPUB_7262 [Trametes pubescens]|uniref:F-box domain-containing protein n=1 Tax=Trametes pubescens TaxID=154538 RepID=A0A1M2V3R3_TRAPU|nr:hypothetical protein TRAPUB_7262 [Trametes pubescens]